MSKPVDRNYIIAARLSLGLTVCSIIQAIINYNELKKNPLLQSDFMGDFFDTLLRGIMISLLLGVVVTLLIWMGYNWMKWVMICFTLFSAAGVVDALRTFPAGITSGVFTLLTVLVNIAITALLFKAPKPTRAGPGALVNNGDDGF